MRVFDTPEHAPKNTRTVVLWGSGAVGQAIAQALLNRGCRQQLSLPNNWQDPAQLQQDIVSANSIKQLARAAEVHHIFAAGSAGFASHQKQCDAEIAAWQAVVDGVCKDLSDRSPPGQALHMHLISSAGGLFEGQLNVTSNSLPSPLRAYGRLKLTQERLLIERFEPGKRHIYRLSSVYGTPDPNHRGSLIANLIVNSFAHRVTRVTGNLDTLRDYLPANDAASYIADRALSRDPEGDNKSGPVTLASGRSASILEVLRIIEQATKRKPLIALADAQNAASVSFQPGSLPGGFAPTDLKTQIGTLLTGYAS